MRKHASSPGLWAEFRWALRLSQTRRATGQTPLRGDLAVFDRVPALGQLLLARRQGRTVELKDPEALLLVDAEVPQGTTHRIARRRMAGAIAVGVLLFWMLPVGAAMAALVGGGQLLRTLGVPAFAVVIAQVTLIMAWTIICAARLFAWPLRSRVTPLRRVADTISWFAPHVQAAVTWNRQPDGDAWVAAALPSISQRLMVPFTVDPTRLVGGLTLARDFDVAEEWRTVDADGGGGASLYVTNPADRRVSRKEAAERRRERGLATTVRAGVVVVIGYLLAGVVGGWLAWMADVGFAGGYRASSPTLGSLSDALYWGLSMMTGQGGDPPSSPLGRLVGVVLQLGSLVLTAAVLAVLLTALTEASRRRADRQASADFDALERAGLLEPPDPPSLSTVILEWAASRRRARK